MDDIEFNTELARLFNEERKKEPYYLESIDTEIGSISGAFYDHYASLMSLQAIATVDDLLLEIEAKAADGDVEVEEADPDAQDPLLVTLNELIQTDIEQYDVLHRGEVHVSGHGLYAYEPDRVEEMSVEVLDENGIGLLEEGESIVGDIERFAVGPVVTFGAYLQTQREYDEEADDDSDAEDDDADDSNIEMPGVWLVLSDARVIDVNGTEQRILPEVLVPISYQTLHFNKVIRRNVAIEPKQEATVDRPTESVYFKGGFITDTCNEIENDLNYGEYSEEELRARREYHQDQLMVYMSMVDDSELKITAFNAIFLNGDEVQLTDQEAKYLQSTIMKLHESWRVVHVFGIDTENGPLMAHILPEHLIEIAKKAQS